MIRILVNRCQVHKSNRDVLDYIISRLKNGRLTWNQISRVERRAMIREAIEIHQENRNLFFRIMAGNF
jgi:hypothetical protein